MTTYRFHLFVYIVCHRCANRVLKTAARYGLKDSAAFMGHGTMDSTILDFIGLNDIRKELVVMVAKEEEGNLVLEKVRKDLKLDRPGKGIAFTVPLVRLHSPTNHWIPPTEEDASMTTHEAIFIIVDKGKATTVIETAKEAGSRGATLINAKGSGIKESSLPFALEIEPQKEIVLILSRKEQVVAITSALHAVMDFEKPGHGILFSCDVSKTLGLYEGT